MDSGEAETLKRLAEEARRIATEERFPLTKPLKKVEEEPDPKILEMVHGRFDHLARIAELEAENEILRKDLELNAAMLARQTDLARNAETEAAELRRKFKAAEAKFKAVKKILDSCCALCDAFSRDLTCSLHQRCEIGKALAAIRGEERD